VVSFTPRLLYPREKSRRYTLDRLGGPQPIWRLWSREKSLALTRNRTPSIKPTVCCCTDWAIPASHFVWG
jgi:hypothetical protein